MTISSLNTTMKVGMFGMSKIMPTPYFVMYENKLMQNLNKLKELEEKTNVHILHTVKSFNQSSVLPTISEKLSGISITSPKELGMAQTANAKHIHLYAPAFKYDVLESMSKDISTLSLNSLNQWETFKTLIVSKGLRINPKLSLEIPEHCNPNVTDSRLGIDAVEFLDNYHNNSNQFNQLEGLHFHALFQDKGEGFTLLIQYIEKNYSAVLPKLKWINLGGGHDFTSPNYDVDTFVKLLNDFESSYPNIKIYFEPGETVTQSCGDFVTTVLDIVTVNKKQIAILDTSIETHLLDVAIVQQKLKVQNTNQEPTPYLYELSGNSCLQGDIIGTYFFTKDLQVGEQIIFEDMMPYTMVKMTKFNGMEKAKFYLV
ncbi:MAG: Carboxynorspermidine decarboxylase, putative (EC [uncultured Sulfurovum sp.]|uniref:Carboxynorspermidine/carboxyspermidine decarboxylase n=1 Tax=uncultured Sulfurovum sp. TaxID=269237 RepID=A0A6S6TAH4_9BACT|nr:MAG: Carboxynorspermidine decarboxylase, putative (EC [uncultured Sulfurovum sp.]